MARPGKIHKIKNTEIKPKTSKNYNMSLEDIELMIAIRNRTNITDLIALKDKIKNMIKRLGNSVFLNTNLRQSELRAIGIDENTIEMITRIRGRG
jgi:hypothetical protein